MILTKKEKKRLTKHLLLVSIKLGAIFLLVAVLELAAHLISFWTGK